MLIDVIKHQYHSFHKLNELIRFANEMQIPGPLNIVSEDSRGQENTYYRLILTKTVKECYALDEVPPRGCFWSITTGMPTTLPNNILGILYLAELRQFLSPGGLSFKRLQLVRAILFETPGECLNAFANIPNPASQMVTGNNRETFLDNLDRFHRNMIKQEWLEELNQCL